MSTAARCCTRSVNFGLSAPLCATSEQPVFLATHGTPIRPKNFSEHWYRCLRAIPSLRMRGLDTTKDTFVSLMLPVRGAEWVEAQTGVAYSTLKKHYAKWLSPVAFDGGGCRGQSG